LAPQTRGPSIPNDGVVRVFRDRGGRRGKTVTLVTGVPTDRLDEVATQLKRAAAAGGGVRDEAIELQGDHRELVAARLGELGFRVKLAGG
jgi:translation initiation factor 1